MFGGRGRGGGWLEKKWRVWMLQMVEKTEIQDKEVEGREWWVYAL